MWFRSDLRIQDNTALSQAMSRGPTIALYLLTPGQWQRHDDAPCKIDFWLRNLCELSKSLAALNVPLLVRQCHDWSDAPLQIADICREHNIFSVHANEEYGANENLRDRQVSAYLKLQAIAWHSHLDQVLFKPGSILTRSGSYFQVYSQFRKVCYEHLYNALPAQAGRLRAQMPLNVASDIVPEAVRDFAPPSDSLRQLWPAGEQAAQNRLANFIDEQAAFYQDERDFPAKPGTSQLSAYLAAGILSPRQCLHAALSANHGEFDSGNPGVAAWINELLWREFYKHILVGYPQVSRHRAFRPETEALPWRDAPDELAAWQQGRTGLPIIDAAMRQLLATGWMHNRLRMIVAMFLTKNLLIDWREGERFFMRHLIDGDLAANNGGWQWSASTGTDAAPYFRIFNPISQSQKFDPDGHFIRQWLPELTRLNKRDIHDPSAPCGLSTPADYPPPIVNLSRSRERALAAFRKLSTRERPT
ncbi:deoxyribodipyrimidine photo-lyase [Pseudomonas sp. NCCP-436]|nr:deoxyribodipyrimidine photo-lyase [Pseudomonas sp. NCCP-436]